MSAASTDGWRLAVGTFSALKVTPPTRVDATVARYSLLLAPLAVLPLACAVTGLVWLGGLLAAPVWVTGWLAVALLALGTRAFHLDGLADTADGLTSSYDSTRSLQVMRSGDVGPAGAAAVVLVLGLQAAGLAALAGLVATEGVSGAVAAGFCVCASRALLPVLARRGVPAASGSSLGSAYAGLLSPFTVLVWGALWLAVAVAVAAVVGVAWWQLPLAVALSWAAAWALVRRARARLGGVTGDVMGASVEIGCAVLLAVTSLGVGW